MRFRKNAKCKEFFFKKFFVLLERDLDVWITEIRRLEGENIPWNYHALVELNKGCIYSTNVVFSQKILWLLLERKFIIKAYLVNRQWEGQFPVLKRSATANKTLVNKRLYEVWLHVEQILACCFRFLTFIIEIRSTFKKLFLRQF